MAGIVLYAMFSVLISTAVTSPCNISDVIGSPQDKYFSWEQNSSCYIFALQEEKFTQARYICASIGGQLTDIEKSVNNSLQIYINTELVKHISKDDEFWIGLKWDYHLSYWYWQNGAVIPGDLTERFQISNPKYIEWTSCVYMTINKVQRCVCGDKKPFICKLNLGCQQVGNEETDICSNSCREFIKQYKAEQAGSSVAPLTPPTTDDNTTNAFIFRNFTTKVYNNESDEVQSSQCKIHQDEIDNKTTVIMVVLGAIAAVLLLTVFLMTVTILKYRRLLSSKEKTQRISLVDILNVDNTQTRKDRKDEQAGSHPGSTTELLYTSVDTAYSLPNRDNDRFAEASDSAYQNQRSLHDADNDSSSMPASPSSASPRSVQGSNLDGHNYSHLNHNGENLTDVGSKNTYGIQSASSPIDQSSGKSPTYESYM